MESATDSTRGGNAQERGGRRAMKGGGGQRGEGHREDAPWDRGRTGDGGSNGAAMSGHYGPGTGGGHWAINGGGGERYQGMPYKGHGVVTLEMRGSGGQLGDAIL